jgi:hypothetical protein
MGCRDGQYGALARLEKQLREALARALYRVQDDRHSRFFALPGHHAFQEIKGREDPECVALGELAGRILEMRQRIGEPTGCLASAFLDACNRWGDITDHDRPGVTVLAKNLLKRLENGDAA